MRTKWINAEFQILSRLTATVLLEVKKTEVWLCVIAGTSLLLLLSGQRCTVLTMLR